MKGVKKHRCKWGEFDITERAILVLCACQKRWKNWTEHMTKALPRRKITTVDMCKECFEGGLYDRV